MQRCGEHPPPQSEYPTETDGADDGPEQTEPEDVPVPPVFLNIARVTVERLGITAFLHVMEHVAKLNRPESVKMRAVRIPFHFGERVMFPVDRDPLLRREAGGQPNGETERERDARVKLQRLVRGRSVQEDRCAEHRNLCDQGRRGDAPE